jgi:multicomponent Na+:H+ antiporter subunit D
MMNALVLPILIPNITAAICLVGWRSRKFQRWVGALGTLLHLASALYLLHQVRSSGIQVISIGDWPIPMGIALVADLFGAIMVVITGIIGFSVALYSLATVDHDRETFGYYPLFNFLLMGVSGAFLTGDLFNLYVWFEVLLMSSFVLLSLGGEKAQVEGAIKYVGLNLLSSALFLAAVGVLYGITGTLNMADLARALQNHPDTRLITVVSMLFLVAFGIKAAVFPLFFWLPASYHTPPFAVSAVFAGLLTKVGVYAIIRVFTLLFIQNTGWTHGIILVLAGLTMITGVLGAVAHNEMRRILSFHIISQIGYMIMGLGLFTPLALAGSIFYIVHHIIVKTNLFLVSGLVHRLRGTCELKELGGLYRMAPWLGFLFLIPALSLAGIPPLSGFFAKFSLIRAGLETSSYWIVGISLVVGLLTLFSMTKIWQEAFWKEPPHIPKTVGHAHPLMILPIVFLASLTVLIGLAGSAFWDISMRAGYELMHPEIYIQAVLEKKP